MDERFSRTALLLGEEAMEKLKSSRVAVFGIGGVGGYAAEALARSGVGAIDLIDNDVISVSNINRQIIALSSTVGKYKTDVMLSRIKDINPDCRVNAHNIFYCAQSEADFDISQFDYIIDAIDTVSSKLLLIENAISHSVPIISSMGTGNKLDATMLEVSDIGKTSVCPLARVMRQELRKRGIKHLKVVYSKEIPIKSTLADSGTFGRHIPASISFVPPSAGLIIAGEVVKELIKNT